jgi:hypothetical protein
MKSIRAYREKAAGARRLAGTVLDLTVREQLEIVARDYEEMAEQLEATGDVEVAVRVASAPSSEDREC